MLSSFGIGLLQEKNCIELRSILSDCRMRDRENLAGSAPRYPHFANHLIQKKESRDRLLGICDPVGMVGFCARRAQRALFQTHSALTDAVFYTEFFNEHKSYYSVIAALANSANRSMRSEFCLLNSRCSKSFFLIERSVVFNTSSIATLRSCAEPMPLRFCKKL